MIKCEGYQAGQNWTLYQGDCVEVVRQMPDASVDIALFSPPFANLYLYSDSERDMGNCGDEGEFLDSYAFLCTELTRVLKPGRHAAVHCKNVVRYKNTHGHIGMHDFRGDIIRAHEKAGLHYVSEAVLWRDPVTEMQKTKAHGLLYKTLRANSLESRMGMPEYVVFLRKSPKEGDVMEPVKHTHASFDLDQWQEWASPVWMDVQHTDTLNVQAAREDEDEKHMCPLSLDVIRRCLTLYSNQGDVVLSPFAGVGSEGVGALRLERRYVGVELKQSYFQRACANLTTEDASRQVDLFGVVRETA